MTARLGRPVASLPMSVDKRYQAPLHTQGLAAALGVSLHMRRALPGVMERFGHRI